MRNIKFFNLKTLFLPLHLILSLPPEQRNLFDLDVDVVNAFVEIVAAPLGEHERDLWWKTTKLASMRRRKRRKKKEEEERKTKALWEKTISKNRIYIQEWVDQATLRWWFRLK